LLIKVISGYVRLGQVRTDYIMLCQVISGYVSLGQVRTSYVCRY